MTRPAPLAAQARASGSGADTVGGSSTSRIAAPRTRSPADASAATCGAGLHDAVARREHLAAIRLHPRDDGRAGAGVAGAGGVVRQELERADRVHEPVADQREALDGGDADPQAR